MYARIAGTGSYLPKKILTNAELEKLVDTSDEWIRSRTGIEQRHVAAEGETTTDLAEHASRRAMDDAGVSGRRYRPDLRRHDHAGPGVSERRHPAAGSIGDSRLSGVQSGGGLHGFRLCLERGGQIRAAGRVEMRSGGRCAETLTRIVDWNDRGTCVLFADGAGAVILKPSAEPGIISTRLHSDGKYKDLLLYPDGVSKGFKLIREGKAGVQMKGNEVYKVAVNTLGHLVTETLNANGVSKDQLDWLIPHQANIRIIEAIAKRLDLPMEKVIVTINTQGNTSAASVPLALDTGIRDGRVKRGQLLLLEAFGGGFTWGSALIRY
jgi:3-oxoacyl-[acyl-carrier-protein] synthase-3